MNIDPKNPAFRWCSGPLAQVCVAFAGEDGTPFLVPKETLRVELAKAHLNGEKVPPFRQFMFRICSVDGPVRRK